MNTTIFCSEYLIQDTFGFRFLDRVVTSLDFFTCNSGPANLFPELQVPSQWLICTKKNPITTFISSFSIPHVMFFTLDYEMSGRIGSPKVPLLTSVGDDINP